MNSFIGHKEALANISRLLARERFPSAALLVGPSGIGKKAIAKKIVQTLACEQKTLWGCNTCAPCLLLNAHTYPDLHEHDLGHREEGSVADIRETLQELQLAGFSNKVRALILDNAEFMTPTVANTLLKNLEEPRPNTFFFIITTSSSKVPATIRSRCHPFLFGELKENEISAIAERAGISLTHPHLALGSLDVAKKLASSSDTLNEAQAIIHSLDAGHVSSAVLSIRNWGKDKELLATRLELLIILTRHKLQSIDDRSPYWAALIERLLEAEQLISQRNCNPVLVLTAALGMQDVSTGIVLEEGI